MGAVTHPVRADCLQAGIYARDGLDIQKLKHFCQDQGFCCAKVFSNDISFLAGKMRNTFQVVLMMRIADFERAPWAHVLHCYNSGIRLIALEDRIDTEDPRTVQRLKSMYPLHMKR
jgi:hypothetical protein